MSHICIIEDDAAIAEIERDYLEINGFTVSIATDRSEERRVGKECRSRWSPYH